MEDESTRPWRRIATRLLWASRWYDVRQDVLMLPDGAAITYTYQDHPGAVMIVPIAADGRVVLLRQYRYLLDRWCWEAPAGGVHPGETAEEAAVRELGEEAGYAAGAVVSLGAYAPSKSVSNERLVLFLATGCAPAPERLAREPTEALSVHALPLADAVAMVHRGEIVDGQTALALLLAERKVRDSGGGAGGEGAGG
jgi:ADP-ribose pyrophosphatase